MSAEHQLTVLVKCEGVESAAAKVDKLEKTVTTATATAKDGGQTISIAINNTAVDFSKSTEEIVQAIRHAEQASEASAQKIIEAVGKIGPSAKESAEQTKEACDEIADSTAGTADKTTSLKDALGGLGAAWAGMSAARAFVGSTLEAAASMESLEKAFRAAGGTMEQFEQVKEMAANTPVIDAQAAVSAVSTLARMGYGIDEAKEKVKTLANAAAYFGKSSADMERAMVQIEQLAGKTTGFSGDLLAISNALPDVKQRLNQAFGTETVEQIQELGVTGQEVAEKLIESYETLPEISAGTQEGLDSMEASFTEIRSELGKAFIPALKLTASVIGTIADGIKNMPDWAKSLAAWAIAAGLVATAVMGIVRAIQQMNIGLAIRNALTGGKGWAMLAGAVAVGAAAYASTKAMNKQMEEEDFAARRAEAKKNAEIAKTAQNAQTGAPQKATAGTADAKAEAREAARAAKDAEKEKTKALKDAEKERADALKAAEKAQKQHEKQMADAARESAREQQKAYAETEAVLKEQQREREALAKKAEDTARRVKEAVVGATAKGQINLASTSMWSQADNTVYSIGGAGDRTAQDRTVGNIKEAFRAVQVETNDRYFAENNALLKSIYSMLSQVEANLRQQSMVKLPTGR